MTIEEAIKFLNNKIATQIGTFFHEPIEVIEKNTFETDATLFLIRLRDGFRVAEVVAYENRAHTPQIHIMLADYSVGQQDEAETRFLSVLEGKGHIAFGDVYTINKSSGLQFVKSL